MANVWENIKNVFLNFGENWLAYLAEAVILYLLFYFVVRTLKEHNAKRLIAVYISTILAAGVVCLVSERLGSEIFVLGMMLVTLFFLFLFNQEIRRSIWAGKRSGEAKGESMSKSAVAARAEEYISAIVRAVQNLSKNNTGALIVLSNGNLPSEIVGSGVRLDANISNQLIEGIFVNKAPLHDGAMIIYGDKIQAAGCFLPLTQRDFPKDFGTRHRAGIGITDVADVSTIIVSEETGIVSVVKRGDITRYADSELLKKFLREYYWKEFNGEGRKA